MTDQIADRRTRILEQIVERVRSWPMSKSGRAALIGVTEAQLDDLLTGRFEDFTLDEVARIETLTGVMVIF